MEVDDYEFKKYNEDLRFFIYGETYSLAESIAWSIEHSDYGSCGPFTVEDISVEVLDHQINSKDSLTPEGQ